MGMDINEAKSILNISDGQAAALDKLDNVDDGQIDESIFNKAFELRTNAKNTENAQDDFKFTDQIKSILSKGFTYWHKPSLEESSVDFSKGGYSVAIDNDQIAEQFNKIGDDMIKYYLAHGNTEGFTIDGFMYGDIEYADVIYDYSNPGNDTFVKNDGVANNHKFADGLKAVIRYTTLDGESIECWVRRPFINSNTQQL